MRNLGRKISWRNIMQSKLVLMLLGILILFFAWNVLSFYNKMQETNKNKKIIEDKVATLEQQKAKLSTDINNLNTVEGKERVFRENFGLAKEGEGMIVIMEDKNPPQPDASTSSGFWSFLKGWFK
jgi:cell division protein FtsB